MADTKTLAVMMLGCGNFARYYHTPLLETDSEVTIAGIFDPSPSDGTLSLAQRSGAKLTATLDALPTTRSTTFAIVTTPHALHAEHVAFALRRGWHVLCDKPFVMKAEEARAISAKATQLKLVNAVAFNRRLDHGCLKAREIIRAKRIGAVRYVETVQLGYGQTGWFRIPALAGGGPFSGRATHMADIVPWLLDRKPNRVRGRVRGGTADSIDEGGFIEVQFDDLECHMTCIEEGWHMWDEIRIFGEDGMIELRRPLSSPIGWELSVRTRRGADLEQTQAEPNPGAATADFIAALRENTPVACSFKDAVIATEIVEQAFASAREDGGWRSLE